MTDNFRIEAGIALDEAEDILKKFDSTAINELSSADQIAYAHAEATVAIAHSLLRIAVLKQDEADERASRSH